MTIPTQIQNQPFVSYTFLTFGIDTRQSLAAQPRGNLLPPSVSSNSMNSLVVEGVLFSKVKSKRSSSTPGLLRCVLQAGSNADTNKPRPLPTTVAATMTAHPSDARGQVHVSRPLHAQLSRPFYPSSSPSCRTPPKHCGSPEHEQHLCRDGLTFRG